MAIIYSQDEENIPADGGIPFDPEKRKASPAFLKLIEESKGEGGAGGRPEPKMEGGRPVNPEKRRG